MTRMNGGVQPKCHGRRAGQAFGPRAGYETWLHAGRQSGARAPFVLSMQ